MNFITCKFFCTAERKSFWLVSFSPFFFFFFCNVLHGMVAPHKAGEQLQKKIFSVLTLPRDWRRQAEVEERERKGREERREGRQGGGKEEIKRTE